MTKSFKLLSFTPAKNPIENSTFCDIGAFCEVRFERPLVNARLEIPYSEARARHVEEGSLRLFQWDEATRSLRLVNPSGVDLERRLVWGLVSEPGLYGVIGLPRDADLLRTVGAFSLFSAEELRASPALIPKVCGLILCAPWEGGGPVPPGGLCEQCLGIAVPEHHLPEVQILRDNPRAVFEEVPRAPAPTVWSAFRHDYRNTGQSSQNGPTQQPNVLWQFNPGGRHLSTPVVGTDGTVYIVANGFLSPYSPVDVFALDGNSGQVRWSVQIASPGSLASYNPTPALGPGGTLYVNGAGNGGLVAINGAGTIKWSYHRPGRRLANPVPSPDGRIYATSRGEGIVALNPIGHELWMAPFANGGDSQYGILDTTPIAVRDDGTLIVSGDNVWALAQNAQVLWTYTRQNRSFEPPTAADDGRVIVFDHLQTVVLSSAGLLQTTWPSIGIYAVARTGVTYVSSAWKLEAVDAAGTALWNRSIPGLNTPGMSTVAIGNDGTVYLALKPFGLPGMEIHALEPATGNDQWLMQVAAGTSNGLHNPVIGLGGTLLVVDDSGALWALR